MIRTTTTDPATGVERRVFDGAGLSVVSAYPPPDPPLRQRVFRQFLTADGTASGSSDMKVNGSVTNVPFWVESDPDSDLYIRTVSFVIADAGATLNDFGNLGAALSNGCTLTYEDEQGTVTISDSLTTNFDFVRLCNGFPPFGDGAAAFRGGNVSGTSEGYLPVLDFTAQFGFQWGLLLQAGQSQRITLTIRDDVSGVDQFDAIVYGFKRLED